LQLDLQAVAGLSGDSKVAAQAAGHVLHHVESDAASGNFSHGLLERETGQEEEVYQLRLGEFLDSRRGGQLPLLDGFADELQLDARAVVGDRDQQHAGAVARFQSDDALAGFVEEPSFFEALAAVVHRIAQQVGQRAFQSF